MNAPQTMIPKPNGLPKPSTPLGFLSDRTHFMEIGRVAAQVRQSHLKRDGRTDADTDELFKKTKDLEKWVADRLRERAKEHLTYSWWSRISGLSPKLVGAVLGEIENFGRFYPVGDPMIPWYIKRDPETDNDGKAWVWVKGIERLPTPSALFKLAAMVPGMKREKGKLSEGNYELKMMVHRLWHYGCLLRKNPYYSFYLAYKEWKSNELRSQGITIMATPKGRFCPQCAAEKDVPSTTFFCPDCNTRMANKQEESGVMFAGHLDDMCARRAKKLFLSHLYTVWRGGADLPVCKPYVFERLGHQDYIDPWRMCDKPDDREDEATTQMTA